jgi:hypothetical protein
MSDRILSAVRSKYGAVAESNLSNEHAGVQAVAEAFGYSAEELTSIPADANMGRSCGIPTVTMGCGDECPHVLGLRRNEWPLRDPKGFPVDEVKAIRNEVFQRVKSLIEAENLGR